MYILVIFNLLFIKLILNFDKFLLNYNIYFNIV